jgi:hypothetical protein
MVLISATRMTPGTNQKCSLQDGLTDESKSSEHSSLSQTDYSISPYARLKAEHPYDKLRSECQLTWYKHISHSIRVTFMKVTLCAVVESRGNHIEP